MALALSRKPGETIVINGNVRVTVVWIDGQKVRLAIEAPENVRVLREELIDGRRLAGEGDRP